MVLCWMNEMDQHRQEVQQIEGFMVPANCNHKSRFFNRSAPTSLCNSPSGRHFGTSHSYDSPQSEDLNNCGTTTERDQQLGTNLKCGKADHQHNILPPLQESIQPSTQENEKVINQVGLTTQMVSREPRIPLGTLIARESGSSWAVRQTDMVSSKSPARKRAASTALTENGRFNQGEPLTGITHSLQQELQLSSGSSSPKLSGTRMGQVFDRIKLFERVGMGIGQQQEKQPVQLGTLLAKERAACVSQEKRRVKHFGSVREISNPQRHDRQRNSMDQANGAARNFLVEKPQSKFRALFADDFASFCAAVVPKLGIGSTGGTAVSSPINENVGSMAEGRRAWQASSINDTMRLGANNDGPHQQLGSLIVKDWPTHSSVENGRLRTFRSMSAGGSKVTSPDVQESNSLSRDGLPRSPTVYPAQKSIMPEALNVEPEGAVQSETRPSLGALFAEDIASSREPSGWEMIEPRGGDEGYCGTLSDRWSVAGNMGESSRDLQVGSSIKYNSSPGRSGPQGKLEAFIAKILTPGTPQWKNRAANKKALTDSPAQKGPKLLREALQEGAGSCSGNSEVILNLRDRGGVTGTNMAGLARGICEDLQIIPMEEVSNPVVHGPQFQHRDSVANDLATCISTIPETPTFVPLGALIAEQVAPTCAQIQGPVSDVGTDKGGLADSFLNSDEAINEVQVNADSNALQESDVQLGTLLEQTWGEHGWLPLGRSRVGSPLLLRSQSSSNNTSRFDALRVPQDVLNDTSQSAMPSRMETVATSPGPPLASHAFSDRSAVVLAGEPPTSCPEVDCIPRLQVPLEYPPQTGSAPTEEPEGNPSPDHSVATPAPERVPARVSLMSLLNQDMDVEDNSLNKSGNAAVHQCDVDDDDGHAPEEMDPMCCVCMVGHKGAAFIPCGHTFCRKCCREVRKSLGSCPLCNHPIHNILNIY